jgi:hypothetical protein
VRRQSGETRRLFDMDVPQLGLHIVSFKDKTLVCLGWPHTLMDAMGKKALLDVWTLILQGRVDKIVPPQGVDIDPLAELGTNPAEPHKLADHCLSMFGLVAYGVSNVLDFVRTQVNRMVCVPASFVAQLRETALGELRTPLNPNPFLSEGDVLRAWWTQLAISHLPYGSWRTIVLNHAYSLRIPLAEDLLDRSVEYVSNAIGFLNVLLSAEEIMDKPISYIASVIRSAIQELGTRAQVEAFASMWRESSGKLPPFFGDVGMHMITFSN